MNFYGADTTMVRDQGRRTAEASRTIEDLLSRLGSRLLALPWEGADADAFRGRWDATRQQSLGCLADMSRRGSELIDHAQEQDMASAPDNGPAGAAGAPGPGGPGAGAASPLGFAGAHAHDGGGGPAGVVPPDHEYSNPLDARTHTAGESTHASSVTIDHGDGQKTTFGSDGSVKEEDKDTLLKHEIEYSNGTKVTTETSETYTVVHNADGSVTYVFDQTHTVKANGSVEAGDYEIGAEAKVAASSKVTVTMPEGSTAADALAIDHLDPSTIPPGASVKVETTDTGSGALTVSRDLLSVGIGAEAKAGQAAVYARSEDGNLSVATGPSHAFSSTMNARLGTDDWHVKFEHGTTQTSTVTEYAEFSTGAAGDEAYRSAVTSGDLPDRIGEGVEDRYTETRELQTTNSTGTIKTPGVSAEARGTGMAIENIQREWPDGHIEHAEYAAPNINGSGSYSTVVGGTGRETVYSVHLAPTDTQFVGADRSLNDAYGGSHTWDNGVTIRYTESELTQMMSGYENRTGISVEGPNDYLRTIAGTAGYPPGSQREAMWQAYNDYNGGEYQLNESHTGGEVPGHTPGARG